MNIEPLSTWLESIPLYPLTGVGGQVANDCIAVNEVYAHITSCSQSFPFAATWWK